MARAATINFTGSWAEQGTSIRFDMLSLALALALHAPLLFVKVDPKKKSADRPTSRLVAVDLIDPAVPKPVEPPPPVVKEDTGLMAKLKALVKKEPPPPPVEKKVEPQKLTDVPKPIELQAKLNTPEALQPKLESKSGFKTTLDPKLVEDKKLAMNAPAGIAPLSAKKLGVMDDRAAIKNSKGNFQMSQKETLSGIGGDAPGLAGAPAAPTIAIQTGKSGSTEKFSAPATQKTDKGKLGGVPGGSLDSGPKLGLRDSIIARDAAPTAIGGSNRAGGSGMAMPTGTKKDAGRSFQGGASAGALGGAPSGAVVAAPKVAEIPKKKEKKSMFTITGPLKDRTVLQQVIPEYPAWAQAQGIEASVVLEFTVAPNGQVKPSVVVRRTSGYTKLDETAISALRQWRFASLPDGENRDEVGLITFNYSLN